MESLKNRRTIRKYSNEPVRDDLLHELLEIAARASTTGNMQLYSVVITRGEDMKAALAPAHFNQPMVKQAPVVLTVCADFNRFNQWCMLRNATPGYDNFVSFFNAAMDALFFAQTFCVAAEEKGLGICYLGTTTYNPDKIIDILGLPKFVMPLITITLGYPEVIPPQPDRLPVSSFIHREIYKEYTPEDIETYYAYKESLPENHQFIAENNKETLAQVFTDVRYKKADNEHFSKVLLDTLKRQGF
ncbi:MAG: nitroreductase family protein [Candidatus Azobacteroides sp.]|nr:nitroreductase family protein [Candidatus Azobacteroides sp.]